MIDEQLSEQMDKDFGKLTPEEYIDYMFDHTDTDGNLYIRGWYVLLEEPHSYRLRMNWSWADSQKLKKEYRELYGAFAECAAVWRQNDETDVAEQLEATTRAVWEKYVYSYVVDDFDVDKIRDISDRRDDVDYCKQVMRELIASDNNGEAQKDVLRSLMDVSVTPEEEAYYRKFTRKIDELAAARLGGGLCAAKVIRHARRLCSLLRLQAPEVILNNEGRTFVAALAVNRFGVSQCRIDDAVRAEHEAEMDYYEDDLFDDQPKKTNRRKSLAPLLIYLALKEHSSPNQILRQQDIIDLLRERPYEIELERKSLSRHLHSLIDSQIGIHSDRRGFWFEEYK